MKKKRKVRRVINYKKIFCFVSLIFILTCCFWYGGRLVYFYMQHKKNTKVGEELVFADTLKRANYDKTTFIKDKDSYYFYHDTEDNYLMYSNLLWRIVKINEDNSILMVLDSPITDLAFGVDKKYDDSSIIEWLNKGDSEYSGVFEKKLNDPSKYLVKTSVCTDALDDVKKITCDNVNDDYYLGLLSINDYINAGAKNSYIMNNTISYLANSDKEQQIWYVGDDGSLNQSTGDDIYGVRPTVTLSPTISIKSGNGSKDDPYKIEDDTNIFASYVKLGDDLWQVYDFDDDIVKLSLTTYAVDKDGSKLEYKYSNNTYRHNDTANGSLAYYLNHTYLYGLSYNKIILDANYYNGYYGIDNDYGLKELYTGEIDTKVGLLSIGDVILNQGNDNYFTSTGLESGSRSVYIIKSNGEVSVKKVTGEANVIPCITIKRENLKLGSGTKSDPYRTE